MKDLFPYQIMPIWNSRDLRQRCNLRYKTEQDTWIKFTIFRGALTCVFVTESGDFTKTFISKVHSKADFIEPHQYYRILSFSEDVQFQLSLYSSAEHYFYKKYQLITTHSDVVDAVRVVAPGQALDLGCGLGRNALYLALKGFNVTAWDKNQASIEWLQTVIRREALSLVVSADVRDLNSVIIEGIYDFILSTVVWMFLNPARIPLLITNIKACTAVGGYNLIVTAMDSDDYPCVLPFPFRFQAGELKDYYQDWKIMKYNEDVGQLHKTKVNGERINLRFATLLACKTIQ
ncbi:SAM-dependent methyltransferase TehB [Candidatus Steffania adelgidicola]|uniref:SAM-dependent methyltransferase TehB n=1 Tax=Candidatus Steffania adelgidicola TaxID=1076626 RepID=UPI001D02ADC1|nr:SAM-dependent methyltransferase TehB [Candidatus Steffania adelgidicola]UDG80047.1 putative S-adenosyl-L-methionine-dependent methyltransferase TehB [Candidatus Steffania adelgidicola]